MRNSFKGICYRCNKIVEAGEGHFELIRNKEQQKLIGRKWRVQHVKCAIINRRSNYR